MKVKNWKRRRAERLRKVVRMRWGTAEIQLIGGVETVDYREYVRQSGVSPVTGRAIAGVA